MSGLGSSPFARRYSENHFCFLFLKVLRCFSSLRSPLLPMYSAIDDPSLHEPGFPIQKSLDLSLFSGSPRLIAANHVFHRLLVPRHPPHALSSLTIKLEFLLSLQHLTICGCQRTISRKSKKRKSERAKAYHDL